MTSQTSGNWCKFSFRKNVTQFGTLFQTTRTISKPKMLPMAFPINLNPSRPSKIIYKIYFEGILPNTPKKSESLSRTQERDFTFHMFSKSGLGGSDREWGSKGGGWELHYHNDCCVYTVFIPRDHVFMSGFSIAIRIFVWVFGQIP